MITNDKPKGVEAQNFSTSTRMGGVSFVDVVQLEHSREMFWSSPFLGSPRKLSLGYGFWNPTGWFVDGKKYKICDTLFDGDNPASLWFIHGLFIVVHGRLQDLPAMLCPRQWQIPRTEWRFQGEHMGKSSKQMLDFRMPSHVWLRLGIWFDTCWYLVEKISYSKIHNHILLDNWCFPAKMWP